jgi:hypothetical protein
MVSCIWTETCHMRLVEIILILRLSLSQEHVPRKSIFIYAYTYLVWHGLMVRWVIEVCRNRQCDTPYENFCFSDWLDNSFCKHRFSVGWCRQCCRVYNLAFPHTNTKIPYSIFLVLFAFFFWKYKWGSNYISFVVSLCNVLAETEKQHNQMVLSFNLYTFRFTK